MIWPANVRRRKRKVGVTRVETLVPNGDFYFVEGKIIIKDDTFDKLVLAVVAHRINNGKPTGNPAVEIEAQIKSRSNEHIS